MRTFSILIILFFTIQQFSFGQIRNMYSISFDNVVHHEAKVTAVFTNLQSGTFSLMMSRTSPGRYSLHEFAKNIYDVKITDGKDKPVTVNRPNLHQWDVSGHDGTINLTYTVFADKGSGTYSQFDETHAIVNNPATFMYAPALKDRPVEIKYSVRNDLKWTVATQMKPLGENKFLASNFSAFMDSPALIGNLTTRKFKVTSGSATYTIRMALDHLGTEKEADDFFELIKKVVEEENKVFGDYPYFENDEYIFLASFRPQVSKDGMEHRNSTMITNNKSFAEEDGAKKIATFAHEFFHSWNVERIEPISLKSFNFDKTNTVDVLWFAEGFTSYYTGLTLCRTKIITIEEYLNRLTKVYHRVWSSPALNFHNPVEISRMAAFHDGATYNEPQNKENTHISYYDYGHMLGLALDLSLRSEDLSLDGFMKLFHTKYGKTEIPYTIENIFLTLREYTGGSLADKFFEEHIYSSLTPDYKKLLGQMAIYLKATKNPYIGVDIEFTNSGLAQISKYTKIGTPVYTAGLEKGDVIISIDNKSFSTLEELKEVLSAKIGKKTTLKFRRNGEERSVYIKIEEDPRPEFTVYRKPSTKALKKRAEWLGTEE